jgi:hypothetical protein
MFGELMKTLTGLFKASKSFVFSFFRMSIVEMQKNQNQVPFWSKRKGVAI